MNSVLQKLIQNRFWKSLSYIVNIKLILFFFLNSLFSCNVHNFSAHNEIKNKLEIKQVILDASFQDYFILNDNKLIIYKEIITKKGKIKKRKVACIKLKKEELRGLEKKVEHLFNLRNKYKNPKLGGVIWNIEIMYNKKNKVIEVENKYVPEISNLFKFINGLIPNNKPKLYPMQ